jgi:hypothetical protein
VSDAPQGEGWWQASDGRWYPPEQHPDAQRAAAQEPTPSGPPPEPDVPPAEGWWKASDGRWYPPEQHPDAAPAAPPPSEPPSEPPAPSTGRETIVVGGPPGAAPSGAAPPPGPPPSGPPPGSATGAAPPPSAPGPPPGAAYPPPGSPPPPAPGAWAPPPGGPPPGSEGKGRGKGKLILAIVVLLALVAAAFVVVTQLSDDEAEAVLLEPLGTEGPNPFTDPHSPRPGGSLQRYADQGAPEHPSAPPPIAEVAGKKGPYLAPGGGEPGLYGGTRDNSSCDPDQLVDFLLADQEKARAWAAVLDLEVGDIPDYVDALTPVNLGSDTRVINHGFADGRATPRQAVLQRGSAVLVDARGVPRVRCYCGNPLLEPTVPTADGATETFSGDRWPAFDEAAVVVVEQAAAALDALQLIDIETGALFGRPVGTKGEADVDLSGEDGDADLPDRAEEPELATGAVQVTLRWSSEADLDLAVTSPLGERVDFSSRSVASGGELDIDANSACSDSMPAPVENIVWPDPPPAGAYTVEVTLFDPCGAGGSQAFELEVLVAGQPVSLAGGGGGTVSEGSPVTFTFEVG